MSDTGHLPPPDLGTDLVLLDVTDRVAILTLNRPAKLNAVTPGMSRALVRAIEWCDTTDEVRALVVTGAGERSWGRQWNGRPGRQVVRKKNRLFDIRTAGGSERPARTEPDRPAAQE